MTWARVESAPRKEIRSQRQKDRDSPCWTEDARICFVNKRERGSTRDHTMNKVSTSRSMVKMCQSLYKELSRVKHLL